MKVCHVSSVHPRYDTRIFHKECVSLQKAGHDVTLLVADNSSNEVKDCVKIESIEFKPRNRFERIFLSPKKMLQAALDIDAEVYHLHDPELLPLALKLKRKGKKVFFDSHEYYAIQIGEKQWIPSKMRKIIACAYAKYEAYVIKRLDGVIGVSPYQMEYLRRLSENAVMITNYPIISPLPLVSIGGNEAISAFVYAGGIKEPWNHERILEALNSVETRYEMMGPVDQDYLAKMEASPAWHKVTYKGRLPHDNVSRLLPNYIAGFALYSYKDSVGGKIGNLGNTKLFEYMAAGIPVICTDFILWKEIIEKWNCGICVNPEKVDEIKNAILFLLNNKFAARAMGANGRRAIETEYNWATQEAKLINLYDNL